MTTNMYDVKYVSTTVRGAALTSRRLSSFITFVIDSGLFSLVATESEYKYVRRCEVRGSQRCRRAVRTTVTTEPEQTDFKEGDRAVSAQCLLALQAHLSTCGKLNDLNFSYLRETVYSRQLTDCSKFMLRRRTLSQRVACSQWASIILI